MNRPLDKRDFCSTVIICLYKTYDVVPNQICGWINSDNTSFPIVFQDVGRLNANGPVQFSAF